MNVVALICARGGSKGVPGKNVRPLGGQPLIAWAVRAARALPSVSRVVVSTDDQAIADAALAAGAEVPFMRPARLAQDDSPEWAVWRHALEHLRDSGGGLPDALLVVPTTAPLRDPIDLQNCLDTFAAGDADVVITVTDAHRNPYFNMVTVDAGGGVSLVIAPDGSVTRRQDAPPVFDMATVGYVARPEFVLAHNGLFEGRVRQVHVPPHRAIDLDTELDFQIAECLMTARSRQ